MSVCTPAHGTPAVLWPLSPRPATHGPAAVRSPRRAERAAGQTARGAKDGTLRKMRSGTTAHPDVALVELARADDPTAFDQLPPRDAHHVRGPDSRSPSHRNHRADAPPAAPPPTNH